MNGRIVFTDIARGIAIFLVVQWHTIGVHTPWTDTWVMPIFFIVMGYFFKLQQPMKILAIKKINSLFIPLLLWSLPMLFLKSLKMSWEEIIKSLLNPYQCVHGVGWFLWCTLWCYLIYNFIKLKLKGNFRNIGILCVALSLASFYLSTIRLFGHRIILPFFVSTSLSCLMFLWLGEWLKNRNLMQLFYSVRGFVKGIFISIVVYGGANLLSYKSGEYISNYFYGQSFCKVYGFAFVGSVSLLALSIAFSKLKLFSDLISFCGQHSLLVLMIHPYVIYLGEIYFNKSNLYFYILCVLISILLTYLVQKYLPVLERGISVKKAMG